MHKLPISLDVESSVESSDSHTHTRENKEPTIPPRKQRRTQPAPDMSSSHPTETANRGDRADSVSPVDKATANHSDIIKTAAGGMPDNPDTCQAQEQACQSTGDVADTAVEPTGRASSPPALCAGRPKHSHHRPIRFMDTIEASASSSLISWSVQLRGFGPHGICRLVCVCAVVAAGQSCCGSINKAVSLRSHNGMSQEADDGSHVGFSTTESQEARAATTEVPAGVAESAAEASETPLVAQMDTDEGLIVSVGRGLCARGREEGVGLTPIWVAPTRTQRRQQPKREFAPRVCKLCFDERIFTMQSAYNHHFKRAHSEAGAFFSAKHQCLIFCKGIEGQARPKGAQADRGGAWPWPIPVPLEPHVGRPMAPVATTMSPMQETSAWLRACATPQLRMAVPAVGIVPPPQAATPTRGRGHWILSVQAAPPRPWSLPTPELLAVR